MPNNEQEEFEFRLRSEQEAKATPRVISPQAERATDPRLLENVGGALGQAVGAIASPMKGSISQKFNHFVGLDDDREQQIEASKQEGQALGLSIENIGQAIRQYMPGMDHDASIKAAEEIKQRMEKLPVSSQVIGEVGAMAIPFGAVGKLATGAKAIGAMTKGEKAAQALKTLSAGGAATAALTPVTTQGDFSEKKMKQAGEGVLGTAVFGGGLSALKGLAGKLKLAYESGDSQAAAMIQKAIQSMGFNPQTLTHVATKSGAAIDAAKAGAEFNPAHELMKGRGGKTPEALGEQIRGPLVAKEAEARAARTAATEPIKQKALANGTPIPTHDIVDFLEGEAHKDTASGRKFYERVINELKSEDGAMGMPAGNAIQSHKLENVRNEINSIIKNGVDGQPIGQVRAGKLNDALKMLDSQARTTIPEWGKYFDEYKRLSAGLDPFRRQEGEQIGKAIKTDSLTGAHEIPSEKVADHILSGGVTRVRAALNAAGNDPAVRTGLEKTLWSDLNSKAQNQKLTPAAMNTFMEKNAEVLKELGLTQKFEAQRGMVSAADAIDKTAIGKMAGAKGNAVDSFDTLGKILDAPTGRKEALNHLFKLTANDPQAREALKYGIAMHGVTKKPSGVSMSRAAVLPDLEASGLFSKSDIANIHHVNQVFDQAMKVGASDKTTAGSIITSIMSHTPGLRGSGRVLKGLSKVGNEASEERTRNLLLMAATDPKAAKNLLSIPTETTIKAGLTAMEKASVFMAAKQGFVDGE